MTLLLTLLAFGLMIFIHELGHFLVARWFGVGIEKFSIGFGRPIAEFERNGVKWRIAWIPLGGFVKMKGENPDDTAVEEHLSFQKKAWWKKALIALSGPFANLLLGLLLFILSFMLPLRVEDQRPVIQKAEGRWGQVFSTGDSLISINGKPIKGFTEFLEQLVTDKEGNIVLDRGGEILKLQIQGNEIDSLLGSLYPMVGTGIGEVIPKTPAYHARLMPGDQITAVDSVQVRNWYAMRELIVNSPRDTVRLEIQRGGKSFSKTLSLQSNLSLGNAKAIGIIQSQPVSYIRRFGALEALKMGAYNTVNFIALNYQMLYKLVQRPSELRKSVGGPVMIASMSQQVGQKGIAYLILFFGSISLMLMIMNLLPIPILDGGHIMFALIEGVIRKPVPPRIQSILQYGGFLLLMMLMLFAFYADISSLILRYVIR